MPAVPESQSLPPRKAASCLTSKSQVSKETISTEWRLYSCLEEKASSPLGEIKMNDVEDVGYSR